MDISGTDALEVLYIPHIRPVHGLDFREYPTTFGQKKTYIYIYIMVLTYRTILGSSNFQLSLEIDGQRWT